MTSIYKLFVEECDLCYIGSTFRTLEKRLQEHKRKDCSSKTLFEIGEVQIELLEICEKENRLIRERYWIENSNCVNKSIPMRTEDEIRIRRREYKKEKIECVCGKIISRKCMIKHTRKCCLPSSGC